MGSPVLKPVDPDSRMVEVDMVRGFALFGVLLVNMYGFGADSIAWDAPADRYASTLAHLLFDSKSWTLFSLLFGFGFSIQLQRARQRNKPIMARYARRLAVLFLIGVVHTLLYDGDILMLYAELGVILALLHRVPSRWLVSLTLALLLVFPLSHLLVPDRGYGVSDIQESVTEAKLSLESMAQEDVYAVGSLSDIVRFNATAIPAIPLEDFNWADSGLAVLALFVLGYLVGRSGVLANIDENLQLFTRVRNLGLVIGFTAMAIELIVSAVTGYAVYGPAIDSPLIVLAGDLLFTTGTLALALGYAGALILMAQTGRGQKLLNPLAGVGRMALTVYLTQTLFFTTLFYSYGLGKAYRMGPAEVTIYAMAFFALQLMACAWWLSRYRMGPVEWLWRSLTYLELQQLRRTDPVS